MPRPKKTSKTYLEQIETEVQTKQSRLSLILGALIVIVVGILIFNYFNRSKSEVGPAQQVEEQQIGDVSPENLPGKYTVKEGDTLFLIAEKYYKDGPKFTEIMKANNLTNENLVEVGQVLEIPKLAQEPSPTPTATETPTPSPTEAPSPAATTMPTTDKGGTPLSSGAANWGPVITGNTYTVVEGDWLSTIAARAYNGDIMAYKRLAEVNKISNPDLIFPGQVITIPR